MNFESDPADNFRAERLERVFGRCFARGWRTRLLGGASEPHYQPATNSHGMHKLHYRSDYFASALHEVAHWCIAGDERRQLADFGYWYAPDGRNPQQQHAFERVEAKPQALEWFFSQACGYRFCVSIDNLAAADALVPDVTAFKCKVLAQARFWQKFGMPQRAEIFFGALGREFSTGLQAERMRLQLPELAG